MSTKRHREVALLFAGTLFSDEEVYREALSLLKQHLGPVLFESDRIAWDLTRYYSDELGAPITRRFIFFERLVEASLLPDIKILTDDMESRHLIGGRRRINIDPGYLTEAKIVLASTKNYSHRIYLGKGVYAEQEYIYSKGAYRPFSHAYPDYRKPEYLAVFQQARQYLRQNLTANPANI